MKLSDLSFVELQNLLEEYPWYSAARVEYVMRKADEGEDEMLQALRESSLFLLSPSSILSQARLRRRPPVPAPAPVREQKPKIYVVGGDYFGKDDFKELEAEGISFDSDFSFNPSKDPVEIFTSLGDAPQGYENFDFCTETLAKVYEEQQFYAKAIEVYNQLILLYPEKVLTLRLL